MTRPFRFGVNLLTPVAGDRWRAKCRTAETLGYDVILVPDHLGMPAPFPALIAAAEATERPRLGTFTLNPTLLAREVATTDQLTGGRLELGLGAGYAKAEHDTAGLPFGKPGERVSHLQHTVEELDRLHASDTFAPQSLQRPRPPLLIGGNGDRVLRLAAQHADIASFAGAVLAPGSSRGTLQLIDAEAMDERVAFFAEAAGPRSAEVERNILVQSVVVTDDRRAAAQAMRRHLPYLTSEQILGAPTLLVGTQDEMAEILLARRERFGISYVCVQERDMATFAPVIGLLSGR
jgi:probable F420-dependent oxidoreductase